jgi:hypothetical protein
VPAVRIVFPAMSTAGHADNEDLTFDKDGTPALKRLAGGRHYGDAAKLGAEIKSRMPERTPLQTKPSAPWSHPNP